jgi:hypothetical protein
MVLCVMGNKLDDSFSSFLLHLQLFKSMEYEK